MKAMSIAMLPQVANLHPASAFAPAQHAAAPRPRSLWQRIGVWSRVARERRRLAELDPQILKDIGLTPEEAAREAARPFWDISGVR